MLNGSHDFHLRGLDCNYFMSDLRLLTEPSRLHFLQRKEPVALYASAEVPGFLSLSLEGNRAVTAPPENGLPTIFSTLRTNEPGVENAPLVAVADDLTVRRGTFSIGFRQTILWQRATHILLRETRTVRLMTSSCEGTALDFESELEPMTDSALLPVQHRFVARLAPPLFGENSRLLTSAGEERQEEPSAKWGCAMGVINGETAGVALLEHPDNPGFPNRLSITETGILSMVSEVHIERSVTLKHRLVTFLAYVEAGWTEARWQDYARRPAGYAPN